MEPRRGKRLTAGGDLMCTDVSAARFHRLQPSIIAASASAGRFAPSAAAAPSAPEAPSKEADSNLVAVKSPMIGTFYRSSNPDSAPFVKVGDVVKPGDAVCIIEAMKLFNEIESEVSGKIVQVLVEDAQPVEYDQPLFLVDPS